ncbi:MAG TPA: NADH-quinone oxidoreductase subunit L [Lacipirellulaceae bacterium]|nr:NADH-quinone oxidoreductase subunit L [Lacipirellulaceae bacterium]
MPPSVQHLVLWLIPLAPLTAAIVTAAVGPTLLRQRSHLPCWLGIAVAMVCAWVLLFSIVPGGFTAHGNSPVVASGYQWIDVGGVNVGVDLHADAMTAIMLAMVTTVSLLVAVYSAGYMHDDRGYARFFAFVSLFVFSMCMLVLAASFLLLYVFWEGVGLCSYLLIGFWYRKPSASAAATKAFVVNRIGDFGFIIGVILIWTTFRSFDFTVVLGHPDHIAQVVAAHPDRITLICLLLFMGAVGKSAQFPLHVWLPDAMEGPSPVSALIHAATMVTAGVYMVARCTPLFAASPTAQMVVSGVGAFTALLAAVIAITQNDLKRVLAYSTVSQLGYMFMALGAGAAGAAVATFGVTAAMFHLITHAFFKSLLFLAAGSVMHAMGDVIDMRQFSGLRRRLPITHWTFLCGALALGGVPPFSGFWSKDEIFASLYTAAHAPGREGYFWLILISAIVTAFVTALYTFRAYFLTFWGEERFPVEAGAHPHEAPPVMAWPLRILAVFAVGIGFVIGPTALFAQYLHHTAGFAEVAEHGVIVGLMTVSALVVLAGVALAWLLYSRLPALPRKFADEFPRLYALSLNKFYIDEIYVTLFVAPLRGVSWLSNWFDWHVIDPIVDGLALVPRALSGVPLWMHNGLVPSYALIMWLGLLGCVLFAMRLLPY